MTSGASGGSGPLGRRLRGDRERDLKMYLVSGQQCWGSRSGYACIWASRIRVHSSEVRIWIRILPFSHKKTEDNVSVGKLQKKNMKKI